MSEILSQDPGTKPVVAKFIPWLLLPEPKERRAAVANDLIQTTSNELDFLRKVMAGDEPWVCGLCDPGRKAPWSQWKSPGSPGPKKVRQGRSKGKTMLTVFLGWEGAVHHESAHPSGPNN